MKFLYRHISARGSFQDESVLNDKKATEVTAIFDSADRIAFIICLLFGPWTLLFRSSLTRKIESSQADRVFDHSSLGFASANTVMSKALIIRLFSKVKTHKN
jgi:hypothetical protein